ncbi:MAG: hypothetical protein IAX21_08385 [Candidatus Bathyarchaeota archaeon]|nr:MAG: hypothetical protein IAX21_08385 [Candidatus Bathyarchaeota archaeon]
MPKEHITEKYLGKVYCKRCHTIGSLVAELETAGNNLHINFYVQHLDEKAITHFVGRKIFKSIKEAKTESE